MRAPLYFAGEPFGSEEFSRLVREQNDAAHQEQLAMQQSSAVIYPERVRQWVDGQRSLSQQEVNAMYANAARGMQNAFAPDSLWRNEFALERSIQRRFDRCFHGK